MQEMIASEEISGARHVIKTLKNQTAPLTQKLEIARLDLFLVFFFCFFFIYL